MPYHNAAKNDPFLVNAKEHEKAKKKYSVASQATVFRRELNLPEVLQPENEVPTVYARNVRQKAKKASGPNSIKAKMGR